MSTRSLFGILFLIYKLFLAFPTNLIKNVIRVGLTARQKGLPLREFLIVAFARTFISTFALDQFTTLVPSTSTSFSKWHRAKQSLLRSDDPSPPTTCLADKITKLHWIRSNQSASIADAPRKVILFFHGGGYVQPCSTGHLDWCLSMSQHLAERDLRVDVAVLEYQLNPYYQYPAQLRQARNALAYIIEDLDVHANNVMIGGDSAGGNLAAALLSHLMHPHPDIESLKLKQPLAGAFMVSPWLTADQSTVSYRNNANTDMLTADVLSTTLAAFRDAGMPREKQKWLWPSENETSWWSGLEHKVNHLYFSAGEVELFRDHIVEFVQMLRNHPDISPTARSKIELDVGAGETHDHILIVIAAGRETNRPLDRLLGWFDEVWTH